MQKDSRSAIDEIPCSHPNLPLTFFRSLISVPSLVQPQRNQDAQVEEDIVLSSESSDPIWYSTVYKAEVWLNFQDVVQPPPTIAVYRAGEQCVSCDFRSKLGQFNGSQSPSWADGLGECGDCAVREMTGTPEQLAAALTTIAAIIAGGVVALILFSLAVWWCRKRRSGRSALSDTMAKMSRETGTELQQTTTPW